MMRAAAPALAALLLLAALPPPAQAQFKWLDADGRVTYGDNPPREARNVERIGAPTGTTDPLAALPFELRRAVTNFPLTLYTTADCSACTAARELLQARGAPFAELTIGSAQDQQAFRALGLGDRLPVLMVGRQSLREFQPQDWQSTLDSAGYPRSANLPRTWKNPPARALSPASTPARADAGATAATN